MLLDKINYTVARLDGDYAYLKNLNSPEDDLKCVARALLPEVSEGSKLRYEMMSYEIMEPSKAGKKKIA